MRRQRLSYLRGVRGLITAGLRGLTRLFQTARAPAGARRRGGLADLMPLEDRRLPSAVPVGTEFRVNTFTPNTQQTSPQDQNTVAMTPGGGFVATWASQGQDNGGSWGVYAQRYDAAGNPLGAEFRVNTFTTGDQLDPAVAVDGQGDFIITWASSNQDGSSWGVYAQRYDPSGNPMGGEFRVNTFTPGAQQNPVVAADAAGDFVIAWASQNEDGSGWGVYAQRYNAAGNAVGGEFRVNTFTPGDQTNPSAGMDSAGNFVIAWASDNEDGDHWGVFAQRYDAAGNRVGGEFRVNTTTHDDQRDPAVAVAPGGGFVIAWDSNEQDGDSWGVYGQRYDAAGIPQGPEFRVNTTTDKAQQFPSAATDAAGNFVVTWSSAEQDNGSSWGVYGQQYDAAGTPVGGEFRVNTTTAGDQLYSSVAADGRGDFTIVWSGAGPGDGSGVFAQRYAAAGISVTPTTGLVTTMSGGTDTFQVVLQTQPTANVTIGIHSSDTTEGTVSASSLTFTPSNWNTPQTVTVTGVNNLSVSGDQPYTVITDPASSADPNYNGLNPADASVTNDNTNAAGFIITPTSGLTTTEAGGTATFSVRLATAPLILSTVNVSFTSSRPGEGAVLTGPLTFSWLNWNVPQTITVAGVDDVVADGPQAYTINGVASSLLALNYNGLTTPPVAVTNLDNDVASFAVSPTSGLTTTETGGQATFQVWLTSQPTASVTVPLSSSNPGQGVPNVSSLTFTPANWSTPQTVTVTGIDDYTVNGDQPYAVVTGPASSADPNYGGFDAPDVQLTNLERDVAGITVQQDVGPSGPEFRVNTTTAGDQLTAALGRAAAADPAGDSVVVWASQGQDGSGWGVYAQRYDAAGVPQGPEFRVNTTRAGDQTNPAVAMDSAGNFVVVWQSQGQDGSGWGVYAQRYDAAGNPLGGEFRVNSTTALDQTNPTLAFSPAGGFLIGWQSATGLSSKSDILAQRYDSAGNAVGGELRINTLTFMDEQTPAVAADGSGDYLIAWHSQNPGLQQNAIYVQRYNAAGNALGGQVLVNSTGTYVQSPAVAAGPGGSVIAWQSLGEDGSGWGVYAQRYDLSGNPVGGEFRVNSTTAGDQLAPALAMDPAGNLLVTWSALGQDAPGSWGVYGQRYDALGNPVSGEFRVNTTRAGDQVNSAVAAGGTDHFLAVWSSQGQDGSGFGVYGQRFDNSGPPTSGLLTTEAGTSTTFSVALTSAPLAPVTVVLANPRPGEDTLSALALTFTAANWNVPQAVTVTGVPDFVVDGDQTFSVALTAVSADPVYSGLSGPAVRVTNQDIDLPWILVSPTSGLVTTESGGTATFTVRLSSQPTASVTVGLTSSDPSAGVPSVTSVTFTPVNWFMPQTVTVTGVDDYVVTGDTPYSIVTAPAVSGDPVYNGQNPPDVALVNRETDQAGITVTPTSGVLTAPGWSMTFTVVLTSQPTADVTIPLSSSDPSAGTADQANLTFTPADWNTPQAVTVQATAAAAPGATPFTIVTGPAVSADTLYGGMDAADVHAVIVVTPTPPKPGGPTGGPGGPVGGPPPAPPTTVPGVPAAGPVLTQVGQTLTPPAQIPLPVPVLPSGPGGGPVVVTTGLPTVLVDLVSVPTAPLATQLTASSPTLHAAVSPAAPREPTVLAAAAPQPVFAGTTLSVPAADGNASAGAPSARNMVFPTPNSPLSFFLSPLPASGQWLTPPAATVLGGSGLQSDGLAGLPGSASGLAADLRQDPLLGLRPWNGPGSPTRGAVVTVGLPDPGAQAEEVETVAPGATGGSARSAARAWTGLAWQGSDQIDEPDEAIDPAVAAAPAAMTGLAATTGYVLLNTRAGSWLLGVMAARPLWRQFDPLEVLFAWEEEQQGHGDDEEEALLSLVE